MEKERGAGGVGERYTAGVINAQCNQPRQMLRRHAALKLRPSQPLQLQRRADPIRSAAV